MYVVNNGYPSSDNGQYCAYIESIYTALLEAKTGYEIELLVMKMSGNGLKSYKILKYIGYYFKLFVYNFKFRKEDIIYIHNYPHSFIPLLPTLLLGRNIIIHWHGDDVYPIGKLAVFLCKVSYFFLGSKVRHIAPSRYFSRCVEELLGITPGSVHISPSGGVDVDVFRPTQKNFVNKQKPFKIGYASHMSKAKGFDVFESFISKISSLNYFETEVEFHIINYGSDKEYYLNRLKLFSNIVIHKRMPKEEMPGFFNGIDMLIMPTIRQGESLGLVVLEAMACDIPILSTSLYAMPEFVVPGISGELFDPQDLEQGLMKLWKIFDNYDSYKPRDLIETNYSKSNVVDDYKKYFS